MGYGVQHALDVASEHYAHVDTLERRLAEETGYRDMFRDWCKLGARRRVDCAKKISKQFSGIQFTLNMEDSTGQKWSEVYLNGELVEEDEEEGVSLAGLSEIRKLIEEIEGRHAVTENIDRADFNRLKGLIGKL